MKQRMRRGANRWRKPLLKTCPECGSRIPGHIACPSCGYHFDVGVDQSQRPESTFPFRQAERPPHIPDGPR